MFCSSCQFSGDSALNLSNASLHSKLRIVTGLFHLVTLNLHNAQIIVLSYIKHQITKCVPVKC